MAIKNHQHPNSPAPKRVYTRRNEVTRVAKWRETMVRDYAWNIPAEAEKQSKMTLRRLRWAEKLRAEGWTVIPPAPAD